MIADFASDRSIKRGLQVILIGLLGFLVWAVSVEIDGAVIASGHVEYSLGRQVVQHPDGGVVSKIHVHDGSEVRAGDPIVTLDGIELIAQRNVIQAQLATLLAQEARLRAEAEG
ncbi:MAG: biotin/lipoyl-binding protein, partial [Marivivens sp.]|nr:biotin/lipoyl-binding protein [Marivivens sp.]